MTAQLQRARDRLRVGAWYSIQYGSQRINFCVIHLFPGFVVLECERWLLSGAETMEVDELFSERFNPIFLGYGKRRWFWGWVRKKTDCFGTMFTKPF